MVQLFLYVYVYLPCKFRKCLVYPEELENSVVNTLKRIIQLR